MEPEHIFLHKREDLRSRCDKSLLPSSMAAAEYRVLMASPLLRELLISKPSLVDRVNRPHGIKIMYRCVPITPRLAPHPQPDVHLAADGFGMVDEVNPDYVASLALDQFLQATVGVLRGKSLTVRDMVDYSANAAGGTHYDTTPKANTNRPVISELNNYVRLGGFQVALYSLMSIGRVVVAGLEPLARAVSEAGDSEA